MLSSPDEKTFFDNIDAALRPTGSHQEVYRSWFLAEQGLFLLPIIAGAAITLPVVYSVVFYDEWNLFALQPVYLRHILLNTACNILIIATACSVGGPMERAIDRLLLSVFVVHTALIFLIVASRLYYSRPVLVAALCTSIACGVGTVWLGRRVHKRRVAAIEHGLPDEMEKWLGPDIEVVRKPSTDLRSYELILVNFEEDLPGPWAKAVSRAILAGAEISHIEEYLEWSQGRVSPDYFSIDHLNLSRMLGPYFAMKRGVDTALIVLGLPVILLSLVLAALGIAISMGRPILFVQNRVGRRGKIFKMYKLRTMRQQRPDEPVKATAKNDNRITSLGRVLRKYHIDELPQIWNVLKGDMSLIGPRPEQPQLALAYAEQIPTYPLRHLMRPGITGWSQVCFGYAENLQETREKLAYDLHYIKYCGFGVDLRIAILTIGALIGGATAR
jgi:lipopolysaccharide/colanic/teichoic acid biosynthesis glycosyltransferase